jgi:hypothetical protein
VAEREVRLGAAGKPYTLLRFSMAAWRVMDPEGKRAADTLLTDLLAPEALLRALHACMEGSRMRTAPAAPPTTMEDAEAVLDEAGYRPTLNAVQDCIMGWLRPEVAEAADPNG